MKITKDFDEFTPWSGAIPHYEMLKDMDLLDAFEQLLEELYPEGTISETTVNDLLWFDSDFIFENLGLKQCPECENWHLELEFEDNEGNNICEGCFNDYFFYCECGNVMRINDGFEDADGVDICEECYNKSMEGEE